MKTCFVLLNTCECNKITYKNMTIFKSQTIYRPAINYLFSVAINVSLFGLLLQHKPTVCTNKRFCSIMDFAPERRNVVFYGLLNKASNCDHKVYGLNKCIRKEFLLHCLLVIKKHSFLNNIVHFASLSQKRRNKI